MCVFLIHLHFVNPHLPCFSYGLPWNLKIIKNDTWIFGVWTNSLKITFTFKKIKEGNENDTHKQHSRRQSYFPTWDGGSRQWPVYIAGLRLKLVPWSAFTRTEWSLCGTLAFCSNHPCGTSVLFILETLRALQKHVPENSVPSGMLLFSLPLESHRSHGLRVSLLHDFYQQHRSAEGLHLQ